MAKLGLFYVEFKALFEGVCTLLSIGHNFAKAMGPSSQSHSFRVDLNCPVSERNEH